MYAIKHYIMTECMFLVIKSGVFLIRLHVVSEIPVRHQNYDRSANLSKTQVVASIDNRVDQHVVTCKCHSNRLLYRQVHLQC